MARRNKAIVAGAVPFVMLPKKRDENDMRCDECKVKKVALIYVEREGLFCMDCRRSLFNPETSGGSSPDKSKS